MAEGYVAMKRKSPTKVFLSFKVDGSLKERLQTLATEKDRTMSSLIRRAIKAYLAQEEARHGKAR